jgi:hypothetical protein
VCCHAACSRKPRSAVCQPRPLSGSRPQLAREPYNSGEAKCRLGHSRLTRLVVFCRSAKEASDNGDALRKVLAIFYLNALYDLVRAAGAPAGSGCEDLGRPEGGDRHAESVRAVAQNIVGKADTAINASWSLHSKSVQAGSTLVLQVTS